MTATAAAGLGPSTSRWPHEVAADPVPDARLPPLRSLEKLAARKAQIAEAALARARRERAAAQRAVVDAQQALAAQKDFVALERRRLIEERQTCTDGGHALRRWRENDQALIDSVPPYHAAVMDRERELKAAETALVRAQDAHRQRARRREKFDMLIEQIVEDS